MILDTLKFENHSYSCTEVSVMHDVRVKRNLRSAVIILHIETEE